MVSCRSRAYEVDDDEEPEEAMYQMTRTDRIHLLRSKGLPDGIADAMADSCDIFARRFWILDNSSSMSTMDGKRFVSTVGKEGLVKSTRWEELCDSIAAHATMAHELQAPTEFRCLNTPEEAPQACLVGVTGDPMELTAAKFIAKSQPVGMTPLCSAIRAVVEQVTAMETALRANNQRVLLVIASDGEPSDGEVVPELKRLAQLPVWVVIRLCTDDEYMTTYWEGIDRDLEINLDILDDLSGEATEVRKVNPFLTYGVPLHYLREWGCATKLVDLLDETRLTKPELAELALLILGERAAKLPSIDTEWSGYVKGLMCLVAEEKTIFSTIHKKRMPWFDYRQLNKFYAPKQSRACEIS